MITTMNSRENAETADERLDLEAALADITAMANSLEDPRVNPNHDYYEGHD